LISLRGVDGCPAGWLSVSVELDGGGKPVPKLFPDAEALFRDGVAVTAIDIPIGLSAVRSRSCDTEARRLLGVRKSSVFPAPVRATLAADSYQSACIASATACGKRLTKQSYALDALAALWTAQRIHAGIAERVTTKEERDEYGLPMQMRA
jgi:predicted RNase H-like nuclease